MIQLIEVDVEKTGSNLNLNVYMIKLMEVDVEVPGCYLIWAFIWWKVVRLMLGTELTSSSEGSFSIFFFLFFYDIYT